MQSDLEDSSFLLEKEELNSILKELKESNKKFASKNWDEWASEEEKKPEMDFVRPPLWRVEKKISSVVAPTVKKFTPFVHTINVGPSSATKPPYSSIKKNH